MEAMRIGCLVVGTDTARVREVIEDDRARPSSTATT